MPQNTKREAKRSKQPLDRIALFGLTVGACVSVVACWLFVAVVVCPVYFDLFDPCTSERQKVVDQVEAFRQQRGRYPKSLEEANINLRELEKYHDWRGYYDSSDGEFQIELYRGRYFPPGDRIWFYSSETGKWHSSSQSW